MSDVVNQWYWLVALMIVWLVACASIGAKKIFWEYETFKEE